MNRKGRTINKEKAKAYFKEYATNGFNKTKAHHKINPTASYKSNNVNANRFHKSVPASIANDSTFDIQSITPAYIIQELSKIVSKPEKEANKIRALELLGDFKRLWADKGVNIHTNIVNKADLDAMKATFGRMLSGKQKLDNESYSGS